MYAVYPRKSFCGYNDFVHIYFKLQTKLFFNKICQKNSPHRKVRPDNGACIFLYEV